MNWSASKRQRHLRIRGAGDLERWKVAVLASPTLTLLLLPVVLDACGKTRVEGSPRGGSADGVTVTKAALNGNPPSADQVLAGKIQAAAGFPVSGGGMQIADSTPGVAEVQADGSTSYDVPLWVPDGVRGMQPNLSIHYNSNGSLGLLGKRWSIGGLSVITRCNKTPYADSRPGPIDFVNGDEFCLDGQRMQRFSGDLPNNVGEFRLRQNPFQKIEATAADATGILTFKVSQPDGRILEYGRGPNSRLFGAPHAPPGAPAIAVNASLTYAYYLDKVQDRFGNSMLITYNHPGILTSVVNDVYPKTITWGGVGNTLGQRSVEFSYQNEPFSPIDGTAPDGDLVQIAGLGIRRGERIVSMKMFGPGGPDAEGGRGLLKVYNFTYSSPTITGDNLLATISECDGYNVCKEPTKITWELGAKTYTKNAKPRIDGQAISDVVIPTSTQIPATCPSGSGVCRQTYQRIAFADVNGDGRDDLVYRGSLTAGCLGWGVRLAQPNGTFSANATSLDLGPEQRCSDSFVPAQQKYGPNPNDLVFADMNQDGQPDIISTNANTLAFSSVNVHLNAGTSPAFTFASSPTFSDSATNPVFAVGDLDGNGVPELIVRGGGVWHGTSMIPVTNGTRPVMSMVSPAMASAATALQIAAIDLDGDGMAEVLQPTNLLGNNGKTTCGGSVCNAGEYCLVGPGGGLCRGRAPGQSDDHYSCHPSVDPGHCVAGCWSDFNCLPPQVCSANSTSASQIGVCQNGPSVPYNTWVSSPTMNGGVLLPYSGSSTARFILDFDRDGLADVAYVSALPGSGQFPPTSVRVVRNTGAGYFDLTFPVQQDLPLGAQIGQSWRSGFEPGVRVTDFNGDGRQDLMLVDNGANATGGATRSRVTVLIADSWGHFTVFTPSTSTGAAIPIGEVADGLVSSPTSRVAGHHGYRTTMLGDFNGDGLTDLAQVEGGTLVTYTRDGKVPDVVTKILEGTGRSITATYVDIGQGNGAYTKDDAACSGNRQNLICDTRGRLVTFALSIGSVKAGAPISTQYITYKGGVSDRGGAGFLGFTQRDITGPAPSQHTRIVSDVTSLFTLPGVFGYFFPLAMKPKTVTTDIDTYQGTNRHHLETVVYDYSVAIAGTTSSLPTFGAISVLPHTVTETSSDCAGSGSCTGTIRQLSYTEHTYTYDAYGNTKTATDVYRAAGWASPIRTDTVVNDYYPPDTSNWLVRMPSQSVATSNSNGSSAVRTTKFTPDFATGEISSIETEPAGSASTHLITSIFRDSRGRLESTVHTSPATGEARATTFSYEDYDGVYLTTTTNALGHRTRVFRHPGLGLAVAAVDPNGAMVSQTFDSLGRPLTTTGPTGAVTRAMLYKAPPAATIGGVDFAIIPENLPTRAESIHLDAFGRVELSQSNTASQSSLRYVHTYDNFGRLLTTQEVKYVNISGAPPGILNTETRTYDNLGRPLTTCHSVSDGTLKCVSNAYDGLSVTTTNEAGRVRTSVLDALGRPSIDRASLLNGTTSVSSDAKFTYGPFGVFEGESLEDGTHTPVTFISHDNLGRPIQVMRTEKAGPQTTGIARRATYNAFGDVVTTAKARFAPFSDTRFWRDTVTFGRDLLGRVTTETSVSSDAPLNVINRRFIWDQTFTEDGGALAFAPNGIGKLNDVLTGSTGGIDNSGGVPYTNCSFADGSGNLCADPQALSPGCPGHQPNWGTELCGSVCVSKRWDDLNCGSCGTICGMGYFCDGTFANHGSCQAGPASFGGGSLRTKLHFDYNDAGQLRQKTWIIDDPTAAGTEMGRLGVYLAEFTYDGQGRLDTLTYPQNPNSFAATLRVQYGYDPYTGTALTIKDIANPGTPIWKATQRSDRGQVETEQLNLGVALTRSTTYYTQTGLTKTSRIAGLSGQYAQLSYTYQADGLPSTLGMVRAGVGGVTTASFTSSFTNDNLGRLASWTANTGAPAVTYQYENGGELLSRKWSGETVTYSGVAAGINTSRTVATQRGSGSTQIDTYLMDELGRTFDTPAASFVWNAEDKIVGVTEKATGARDTIVYDGMGQRVLTLFSGGDAGKLVTLDSLYELSWDAAFNVNERRHLFADGHMVGDIIGSSPPYSGTFYLEDNTRSVVAEMSHSGVVTARAPRDPFGNAFTSAATPYLAADPIAADPDGTSRQAFGGHPRDRNWGVVDMLARNYSPRLGRFLSADTVLANPFDRRAHNSYSYVYNSPTSLWDPTGHEASPGDPDPNPIPDPNGGLDVPVPVVIVIAIVALPVVLGYEGWKHRADIGSGTKSFFSAAWNWLSGGGDSHPAPITLANTVATVSVANGGSQVQGDSSATSAFAPPGGYWGDGANVNFGPNFRVVDTSQTWRGLGELAMVFLPVGGLLDPVGGLLDEVFAAKNLYNATRGGAAAVRVGQAGEVAVRSAFNIGEKAAIDVAGRVRIPDGLTSTVLSEVKNVGSLSYTQQLRDFAQYAGQRGLRFDLFVRPTTQLSGPLSEAIQNGVINLRFIP